MLPLLLTTLLLLIFDATVTRKKALDISTKKISSMKTYNA